MGKSCWYCPPVWVAGKKHASCIASTVEHGLCIGSEVWKEFHLPLVMPVQVPVVSSIVNAWQAITKSLSSVRSVLLITGHS